MVRLQILLAPRNVPFAHKDVIINATGSRLLYMPEREEAGTLRVLFWAIFIF